MSSGSKNCPNCFADNDGLSNFCPKCGHPIGNFVNIDPIGQINSQGQLFSTAVNRPRSRIILIGLWVYFGIAITGVSLVLIYSDYEFPIVVKLFFLGVVLLSGLILYKATKNFIERKS